MTWRRGEKNTRVLFLLANIVGVGYKLGVLRLWDCIRGARCVDKLSASRVRQLTPATMNKALQEPRLERVR